MCLQMINMIVFSFPFGITNLEGIIITIYLGIVLWIFFWQVYLDLSQWNRERLEWLVFVVKMIEKREKRKKMQEKGFT